MGCSGIVPNPSTSDAKPRVLATFTVLADVARQVACDKLQVESITKPGAEIHGYEFTPSDLRRFQGAELVLENGLDLDLWSRRFTANLGNVDYVTLSEGVGTIPIGGVELEGRANPHAWMSPRAAQIYVRNIRDAFIKLAPEQADVFNRCANAYNERLDELDQELATAIASLPAKQRVIVSCEGAFSYMARDYGLEEAYLWPVNGEGQVTPQRMQALISTVKNQSIPAVFCESTVDDRAQRRVAAETGARFGGTFHVDSLSGPDGPASSYIALMRHNVATLVAGLASPSGQDLEQGH